MRPILDPSGAKVTFAIAILYYILPCTRATIELEVGVLESGAVQRAAL